MKYVKSRSALILALPFLVGACFAKNSNLQPPPQLGVAMVGEKMSAAGKYSNHTCGKNFELVSDCSARDKNGLEYTIFDGGISRVRALVGKSKIAPYGVIKLGGNIEDAQRAMKKFRLKLKRYFRDDGVIVLTSDYTVKAKGNILYSIDIIADRNGKVIEVTEGTNF